MRAGIGVEDGVDGGVDVGAGDGVGDGDGIRIRVGVESGRHGSREQIAGGQFERPVFVRSPMSGEIAGRRERRSARSAVVRALGVLDALVLAQGGGRLKLALALIARERLVRGVSMSVFDEVIPAAAR